MSNTKLKKKREKAERNKPKNLGLSKVERRKRLNRERVNRCMLHKKVAAQAKSENNAEKIAYKTPQTLGKAVSKVKFISVVSTLASDQGIDLSKKKKRHGNLGLSADTQ